MVAQIDATYRRLAAPRVLPRLVSYALFEGRPVTTRGQWINPLLFAAFGLIRRLPPLRRVERPLYIVGTGRSGTTILGVVLSVHRQVGFLNEPKAMWHALHGAEDVIGSYSRGPARYRLDATDADARLCRDAARLFGTYLAVSGQRRLVDKYPELIFRVPFVQRIFPDARFVFLTRNGWDACASIEAWSQRKGAAVGGEIHDWWGVNGRKWQLMQDQLVRTDPSLASIHDLVGSLSDERHKAAVEWVVTMREGLRRQAADGDAFLQVPYERLVAAPEATLNEILHFAGLDQDPRMQSYAAATPTPAPSRDTFDMPAPLRDLFLETMDALGYGAAP